MLIPRIHLPGSRVPRVAPFAPVAPSATVALLAIATLAGSAASAQHVGDVALSVADGAIATGRIAASGIEPTRTFGTTFGDTGVARFTSNPGFEAAPGTFVPGSRVGFSPRSGLTRFTGSALEPVTTERLQIKFLTLVALVGPEPVPGFDLAVASNGGWHRHLGFTLLPSKGTLPPSGLYVLELELYSTDGVTLPSAPAWFVFNDGRPAAELDAAIAWVETNLAGGPACGADLDGDGDVGALDLSILLAAWATPDADLDGDGDVGALDLSILLAAWGSCS